MRIVLANFPQDLISIQQVAEKSFSTTPDSTLDEWFSFDEMQLLIQRQKGLCLKAVDERDQTVGMVFAAQESIVNGNESSEKWMIYIIGVVPEKSDQEIGSALLESIENEAKSRGVKKMFVFTNKDDEGVIHFYHKNNYEDAGWIKDYQYGKGNSAVFLLKFL